MRWMLIAVLSVLTLPAATAGQAESSARQAIAEPGLFVRQGETWFFKVTNGQPSHARKGDTVAKPGAGEIRVTLNGGMMEVLSGSPVSYNYQAFITGKASDKGKRTSVCTLEPGVAVFESWPDKLPGIRLANFEEAIEEYGCF